MPFAPTAAQLTGAEVLAALPEHRRDLFAMRLDRWWPELIDGLTAVYPADDAAALADRLVRLAATAFAERDPELGRLDLVRTLEPDWFQSPEMLGYAAYAERFAIGADGGPGNLAELQSRIGYLRELGVRYLHLMPLLLPRDGESDGGYAVADYRIVRPDLGTVEDLSALARALRAERISLVIDLVLNHVAREHPWAVAARAGDPYYRAFFRVFADRTEPDAYERTLPEVFPDFAPGNFTWDEQLQAWVWTTFNTWQWDVNWANPEVFYAYADIILFLANAGVEVLRLDAVAFLWKRPGTDSQNQPEVHAITQALRAVARIACPAVLFKAEAIVAPAQLVQYLGQGEHHGKVSDLAYHNSLMVQIWSMLAAGDVRLAAHALSLLPPIPASTSWMTYVRCHDDIGWAIDDGDAAAVGLNGYLHRQFLSDYYSGQFPGSPARGLVFQHNPVTGDRRISGSMAALAGLDAAVEAADTDGIDRAVRRILLAHTLVLGWGGLPVLWMGDELGLGNDAGWADEPGHGSDNRWVHRPRMDWHRAGQRHDDTTVPGRLFGGLRHVVEARASLEQLHASVPAEIEPLADPGILPVARRHPLGTMLGLYNMTDSWRPFPGGRLADYGVANARDVLTDRPVAAGADGNVWLQPYGALWLVRAP